jgi:hypothetical protein
LEGRGRIGESEGHDFKLEEAGMGDKRSFWSALVIQFDLPET